MKDFFTKKTIIEIINNWEKLLDLYQNIEIKDPEIQKLVIDKWEYLYYFYLNSKIENPEIQKILIEKMTKLDDLLCIFYNKKLNKENKFLLEEKIKQHFNL